LPATMDPAFSRFVFRSIHGFSHIIITQSAIAVSINYSPDWQIDSTRRSSHLRETVSTLFRAVDVIDDPEVLFCGLMTLIDVEAKMPDPDLVRFVESRYVSKRAARNVFDAVVRLTDVDSEKYFVNITYENYRNWHSQVANNPTLYVPLPHRTAQSRGIRLTADVNDRFSFNEVRGYRSNINSAMDIIALCEKRVTAAIVDMMES